MTMFNKLYGHYKDDFDMEMQMRKAGITYARAYQQAQKSEEWF